MQIKGREEREYQASGEIGEGQGSKAGIGYGLNDGADDLRTRS